MSALPFDGSAELPLFKRADLDTRNDVLVRPGSGALRAYRRGCGKA
ncbi:hypothetical protein [Streptomyces sp. NPDC058457]